MHFADTRDQTRGILGSGCGSDGRAVASNSRGLRFESIHCQKFILNINCQLYWKDKNKEKEAWNGPFLKKLEASMLNDLDTPEIDSNCPKTLQTPEAYSCRNKALELRPSKRIQSLS